MPANTSADHPEDPEEATIISPDEAEEVVEDADGDVPMDSDSDGDEPMEVNLVNDANAYFDKHSESVFSIAAHPIDKSIFLTGGGDDLAYIWTPDQVPTDPEEAKIIPREGKVIARLTGHKDSVSAAAFLGQAGQFAVTGGLDGRVQVYDAAQNWRTVDEAQEVEEVNWISAHPSEVGFALGANDGSVWVYSVDPGAGKLTIKQVLTSHTASCTAGVWASDGKLLVTVSEDGSFYAWDVDAGRSVVALTAVDQRFAVEGGLYSVALSPSGSVAVVGGATGEMRVVGMPTSQAPAGARRTAGRPQAGGGGSTGGGQAGQILAALHTHTESVESLSFHPTQPLLASGGVDGIIVIYDAGRGYPVRKTLGGEGGHYEAVVKVEFAKMDGWILTSCGVDGTVRRWDVRAGTELSCWRGHLGGNATEGEGGVLGFVQTPERIVTAGDDGVALVFEGVGGGGIVAPTIAGAALG
ncbi:WD40-repeat-containing domain protein [Tuber brumale]|nr:WD40-repeat-containing domain protein [Tuber brumale]